MEYIYQRIREGNWTRNTMARDMNDAAIDPNNAGAVKWCLNQWLIRQYGGMGYEAYLQAYEAVVNAIIRAHPGLVSLAAEECLVTYYNDFVAFDVKEIKSLLKYLEL